MFKCEQVEHGLHLQRTALLEVVWHGLQLDLPREYDTYMQFGMKHV
jgi:hypothetical protein